MRVLKRPRGGWARRPNDDLPNWLLLVFGVVACGLFVNWISAAFAMVLDAAGL